MVVFERAKTPMAVFPPSEQRRIRRALGIYDLPHDLAALAREIAAQCERATARAKLGRLSAAQLAETRENLAASWRHALCEATSLDAETREYWLKHLPGDATWWGGI